ncbi:MAG: D-2-hydroxyacid dehydrogenase [Dehalococcoidia bacterium]
MSTDRFAPQASHPNKQILPVLLAGELPPMAVEELRRVDDRIVLVQLSDQERSFYSSKQQLLVPQPDELRQAIRARLAWAQVLLTFPQTPPDLSRSVPSLRWLQLLTAGADELPDQALLERVPVTTIREVRARPVAEYAMLLLLAFAKRLDGSLVLKRTKQWERLQAMELRGRTVGIIGLGAIGSETAQLAKAFGLRVLAIRRTPEAGAGVDVDKVLAREQLADLLGASDFVVLTAPSTPETYHLIGEAELRAMQRHAVLINVARGALVDEKALIQALAKGWIAGAGLDVFEEEPLSPSSPLYTMDNVLVSCHSAGTTDQFAERVLPVLADNFRRFLAGQPLRNQVDPRRGY